jgi:hypothetical protein
MTGLQNGGSPFNGILFYQRPRAGLDPIANLITITGNAGPNFNLGGTVYAQWALLNLNGGGKYTAQLIVGSLNLSGNSNITINAAGKSFGAANAVFLVE